MICLRDVTLSVYPHRAGLKNMPGHGGNRTYDLGAPDFCKSVRTPHRSVKIEKIACFHGNKRLDQSEYWILTF